MQVGGDGLVQNNLKQEQLVGSGSVKLVIKSTKTRNYESNPTLSSANFHFIRHLCCLNVKEIMILCDNSRSPPPGDATHI